MVVVAYPAPGYEGLVAPSGYRFLLYSTEPLVAVVTSSNETLVYWRGLIYGLKSEAVAACHDDAWVVVALSNGSLYSITLASGDVRHIKLGVDLRISSLTCSHKSLLVAGVRGNDVVVIDVGRSQGYVIENLKIGFNPSLYLVGGRAYIVGGGSSLVSLGSPNPVLYLLPEVVSIKGVAVLDDNLIAYGSWEDSGLLYAFNRGEALLIQVPGRRASIDSLYCHDYRCVAIVIPQGDWPIVVEFNNLRYTSEARVIGVKPFVYHGSGSSNTPWFSGEFIGLGVVALSIWSTREAVVGFNDTHAVVWVEGYVTPPPRLSKIKVYPTEDSTVSRTFNLTVEVSEAKLETSGRKMEVVKPHVNKWDIGVTLTVIVSPILVYLYVSYIHPRTR